jgi:uncharacterized membrane protein YdjX (TVP38/TMEM64 family)
MKLLEDLRRHRVKIIIVALTLAGLAWWIHRHYNELSKEAIIDFGRELHAAWFVALFLVLPLVGFPKSVFHILSGLRFGFAGGMAVSVVAVFFHSFAAYYVTHGLFRSRLRAFLERRGYAIPPIDASNQIRVTLLFTAIPGPPYVAKLYLLALTDISFRIYLLAGPPIHAMYGVVPVAAGSAVTTLPVEWVYLLIGAIVLVSLLGYWIRVRMARRVVDGPTSTAGNQDDR